MQSLERPKWPALDADKDAFRLLVEGVSDYAIFLLRPDGTIRTWNAGAVRLKGYEASEITGKHFSVLYPPDAIERGWPQYELKKALEEGQCGDLRPESS